MQVVPGGIVRIDHEIHVIFVHQIFKTVLHETGDHGDVADPRLMKLADSPLDQRLSVDLDEGFGCGEIDRHHSHAKTGRKNDRVAGRSVPDLLPRLRGQLHISVQVAFFGQLLQGLVDSPDAAAHRFGQGSLVDEGLLI